MTWVMLNSLSCCLSEFEESSRSRGYLESPITLFREGW